jgi:hypothetical protein
LAGRSVIGAVKRTWRRSGVTSSRTPAISPHARDHAPAAQMTVPVATVPWGVWTPLIVPSTTSMRSTGVETARCAPC